MRNQTTNNKEVKAIIRKHVGEYYTPQELKLEVEAAKCAKYPTDYLALYRMAQEGTFLLYTNDILDFLKSLNINPTGKKYSAEESVKLYCHLIARDAQYILKHCN